MSPELVLLNDLKRRIIRIEKAFVKQEEEWMNEDAVIKAYPKSSAKTLYRMRTSGAIKHNEWRKREGGKGIQYKKSAIENLYK
jgi:hypothetical protein